MTHPYDRRRMLSEARAERQWDLLIIGGGATGMGMAVDAASRGLSVLLVEQCDFGKGTSSRSTKLIHGGLRYLQQGNVGLVRSALRERGILRKLAPHVVYELPMAVPTYRFGARAFYGLGLTAYDWLAGHYRLRTSRRLSPADTLRHLPTIRPSGLRGGVLFYDGAFDDTRLLINLFQTAVDNGALCLNYVAARQLIKHQGAVRGAVLCDIESGDEFAARAAVVVNATGPFVDQVRRMDDPSLPAVIAPSQGVHLVVDRKFLPGDTALLVPRTRDGRVMFAIPWHDRLVVGTTDTPRDQVPLEPRPLPQEIEFLLATLAQYLQPAPSRGDILSAVAGIRPLVRGEQVRRTASLARDHSLMVAPSGLLTVAGGKWTTYRKMAQDGVDRALVLGKLQARPCRTETMPVHGHQPGSDPPGPFAIYGSDAQAVRQLCGGTADKERLLHPRLPYQAGQVLWAVRQEMARTVDDVLARRTRALWLDARAALEAAPLVARLMAAELDKDQAWQEAQITAFQDIAQGYFAADG
jgi:glycerol-3-phosphate dehydrogenase